MLNLKYESEEPIIGTQLIRVNQDYLDLDHHAKNAGYHLGWYSAWFFLPILTILLVACWNPDLLNTGDKEFWRNFSLSIGIPVGFSIVSTLPMLCISAYFIRRVSSCRFDRRKQTVGVMFCGEYYSIDWVSIRPEFKRSKVIYNNPGHLKAPSVVFDLMNQCPERNEPLQFNIILMEDERRENWMSGNSTGNAKQLWSAVCQFMESGPGEIVLLQEPQKARVGFDSYDKSMRNASPFCFSDRHKGATRLIIFVAKVLAYLPTLFASIVWSFILKWGAGMDRALPGESFKLQHITPASLSEALSGDEKKLCYAELIKRSG